MVEGQVIARVRFGDKKPPGLRQNQRLTTRILIDEHPNVLMVERGSFVGRRVVLRNRRHGEFGPPRCDGLDRGDRRRQDRPGFGSASDRRSDRGQGRQLRRQEGRRDFRQAVDA